MKKGLTVVLVLAAFVLTGASMVSAQEKEMKVTVTAGADEAASCAKKMKLTDEQKTKLDEMRRECSLKGEELRADLMKLRVAMKRAMGAAEPNMAEIEAVVKKMSAVREKMQMNRVECMLSVRKLLGPDWRAHCCGGGPEDGPLWIGAGGDELETFDIMIDTDEEPGAREMRVMRFRSGDECAPPSGHAGRRGRTMTMIGNSGGCCGAPMPCAGAGEAAHAGCPMMLGRAEAASPCPSMKTVRVETMGSAPEAGCAMKMKGAAGHGGSGSCAASGSPHTMVVVKKGPGGHACSGSCASHAGHRNRWESRMFRPHGKKSEHRCSGDCKQMESGCKKMKP